MRYHDFDRKPLFVAAPSRLAAMDAFHRIERDAKAAGCLIREVPQLGSPDPGPFSPKFKVTRDDDGIIIAIERRP